MNIFAFIFAVVAGAIFVADYVISKSLIALGLSVFTVAYILTFVASGHAVTF